MVLSFIIFLHCFYIPRLLFISFFFFIQSNVFLCPITAKLNLQFKTKNCGDIEKNDALQVKTKNMNR